MPRVCLFDLDGTLVDSREPILTSLNAALADHGLSPIGDQDLSDHVGPPLRDSLTLLLEERRQNIDLVVPLINSFRDHYSVLSVELARPCKGIPEVLNQLHPVIRMGVVTSKPAAYARPILEALGFAPLMEVIEGPSLAEIEPKTETLARALRLLDHVESEAGFVLVGDRHHDIEAARANGIDSIGVTWGFGTTEELSAAGAGRIVTDAPQLAKLLLS
jgi:phosphoglycolate phosphatase